MVLKKKIFFFMCKQMFSSAQKHKLKRKASPFASAIIKSCQGFYYASAYMHGGMNVVVVAHVLSSVILMDS